MYKPLVALLGMLLGSYAPAAAQTRSTRILRTQEQVAPTITMLPTVSTVLPAGSTVLPQDTRISPAHFNRLFVGAYEHDPSLERPLPIERVKNLFLTQVSLPLVQLWGGRLQLGAFQSTLHTQNAQLGLSGYGGTQGFCSTRQSFSGGPSSVRLSGLSLSLHFGGDARAVRPTEVLRRLTRVAANVLN